MKYIINTPEDYNKMLETVKDGDIVNTVYNKTGNQVSFIWMDFFDRPRTIEDKKPETKEEFKARMLSHITCKIKK